MSTKVVVVAVCILTVSKGSSALEETTEWMSSHLVMHPSKLLNGNFHFVLDAI